MLEAIKDKLRGHSGNNREKYNYLREYLQLLILKILDEKGYFNHIAFVGGTALRILYDLNRFSEDLVFSLTGQQNYSFADSMKTIKHELNKQNLTVDIATKDQKTVASAFIKFDSLLFELGLSAHKDQKLSVKFEVDQNPPLGYQTEFSMINKEFLIGISHYDLPSLFAGKLHALLCRTYTKGRDYYDLLWYLGKKITPNYALLENAIQQTEHEKLQLNKEKLVELLTKRIEQTDFKKIRADVEPFLADEKELRYFDKNIFLSLIAKE